MLTVASIDKFDTINAPKDAAITIWFSGCKINCHNCHNPKLQDFKNGKELTPTELFALILDYMDELKTNSIVLLGGEPLDQDSEDLHTLCTLLSISGANIHLYTGYEFEDIYPRLLRTLYWIKTGRYVEEKKVSGKNIASSNQILWNKENGKWRMMI